ncbi:hypothetical protein HK405_004206, partial [Cladochytrium tenue]
MSATTIDKLTEQFDIAFHKLLTAAQHPVFSKHNIQLGPPKTTLLPAGHVKCEGRKAFPIDTLFDEDLPVTLRDGVKIYTNIFRPATTAEGKEKVPAIIAWSPYGKNGGANDLDMMPFRMGVAPAQTSGYEKFESPDPADWCNRGYALVYPDSRGAINSEGKIMMWGPSEAEDIHDTIDWVSKQEWCNGSVTMAGNSWLSVCQQNYASYPKEHHPALKCLAPWWGFTDMYRHLICEGGIPTHVDFVNLFYKSFCGNGEQEDIRAMLKKRPLYDDYWATKNVQVQNIDIPLYICAGWISFHCPGSFNTWRHSKTNRKWLRVTTFFEWYDLYKPESNDDLQRFYDHYLKGRNNGWETDTPPVRLSLFGFEGSLPNVHNRPEKTFPLSRQQLKTLYLDGATKSLVAMKPSDVSTVTYDADSNTTSAPAFPQNFTYHFTKYTEVVGYAKVKLWVSCATHDDMDIFVNLTKVDKAGKPLVALNFPIPAALSALKGHMAFHTSYSGPQGALRASHRVSMDPSRKSADGQEIYYGHDRQELIAPGTPVELEISLYPMGIVFAPGEGIMLRVASHEFDDEMVELRPGTVGEKGWHVVHSGGPQFNSLVVLPVVSEEAPAAELDDARRRHEREAQELRKSLSDHLQLLRLTGQPVGQFGSSCLVFISASLSIGKLSRHAAMLHVEPGRLLTGCVSNSSLSSSARRASPALSRSKREQSALLTSRPI